MPYVLRKIREEELFETGIDMETGGEQARLHGRWLRSLLQGLGVGYHPRFAHLLAYLAFRDVEKHTDGCLTPFTEGDFAGEQHFYVNVQLRGSGRLLTEAGESRVEPGDVYLLDQRGDHQWVADGLQLCRAISFALPESVLLGVLSRLSSQPTTPLVSSA